MVAPYAIEFVMLTAIFSVFYAPFISVLLLRKLKAFDVIMPSLRTLAQVFAFVIFATLTVYIIRANPYGNTDWLLLYTVLATVAYGLLNFFRKRIAQRNPPI